MIKVQDGTRSGKNLCKTCQYGTIRRGEADSDEQVHCNYLSRNVTTKIVECNRYEDRTTTSIHDMYQIAWVLETSKNKRTVGFTPWREYIKNNPEEQNRPIGF